MCFQSSDAAMSPLLSQCSRVRVKPLRLLYALGPGDVIHSFSNWKGGIDVVSETSRTWSGQFFDFCHRFGHQGHAISYFGQPGKLTDGAMIVENRPKRLSRRGIRYHISEALYAASIMWTALRWRADVLIVDSGTTHWALMAPLKLTGVRIVGMLHNVPWPSGYRPKRRLSRILFATEGWFWRRVVSALISVSPECERQVRELAGNFTALAVQCRAQFNRTDFASIPAAPPIENAPLRIMFAGRIERNKGVFDIVEIASLLERSHPGRVRFDICGGGPALKELNEAIQQKGLEGVVRTHGRLIRPDLLKQYAACHAVIVPTRSDFCEGMPQVAAEAILCGRPVITSRLSNALDVLAGALVIAEPDDPRSYVIGIERILHDSGYYEGLCAGCPALQEQFYDSRTSLTAAFETVFNSGRRG